MPDLPSAGTTGAPPASHFRALTGFYLFLGLGFFLPLFLVWKTGTLSLAIDSTLAWCVVVMASGRLAFLAHDGSMRLINLTFWVYVYVWLGVSPLMQIADGEFPLRGFYARETVAYTFVVILVGLAAFELGRTLHRHGALQLPRLSRRLDSRELNPRRALVTGSVAALLTLVIAVMLGGVSVFFGARADVFSAIRDLAGETGQAKLQMVSFLLRVPPFVAIYLLWFLWIKKQLKLGIHGKFLFAILLVVLATINALVNNPVNSARHWFGSILLSLLFVSIPWKKASFAGWTLGIIGALVFVFPYADLFRYSVEPATIEYRGVETLIENGDFDSFQQVMNSVVYVEENGYSFGKQFLGTMFFWVPRNIWRTKPVQSGELVGTNMGYINTNLSLPLWGEVYLDGGIVLVVLGFIGYGLLVSVLEESFLRSGTGRFSLALIFGPVYAAYQFFLIRGSLMSTFAYLVPVAALLVMVTRSPVARDTQSAPAADGLSVLRPNG